MALLTVTVVMETNLDDSIAVREDQVAEALGWLGDVHTVDITLEDDAALAPDELEDDYSEESEP